jgi:TRAP-type C4-dicarboxylate transport system permease small subunit
VKKLGKHIESFATFIGTSMLLVFIFATVAQIVYRDVLKISAPWTEEVSRFAFIWMVCFGTVAVQARQEHISMDFVLNKVPEPLRSIFIKIFSVASIMFLAVVFIGAIKLLERSSQVPLSVSIPWLKVSFLYIPLIITIPLIIFYLVINIFSCTAIETRERNETKSC